MVYDVASLDDEPLELRVRVATADVVNESDNVVVERCLRASPVVPSVSSQRDP